MRTLFILSIFVVLAGCSHFQSNTPDLTNTTQKNVLKPQNSVKSQTSASQVLLAKNDVSLLSEHTNVENRTSDESSQGEAQQKSEQEYLQQPKTLPFTEIETDEQISRLLDTQLAKLTLSDSSKTKVTQSSESPAPDVNNLIDQYLKLAKQGTLKTETTDFSEYGFITPSHELETRVNDELRELRPDAAELEETPNLLLRVRNNFKLDLSLTNRRIENQLNWYVRNPNYLDRTFKRSARYMHYIVQEIHKRDLPMELALLPFVESAYDPFAYSHGRASGLWQFIPGTGRIYGLHQNWWYDGRRDVPASTKAALDYLTYLNERFDGNWLHALAAYNSGSGRVGGAIRKNKKKSKSTDFWSLHLPKETKAYVPKLLAMAKIVLDPEAYGITLPAIPDEPYFKIIKTGSQIDLAQAANLANIDINEIYKLNPGFNQWASAPLGPHRLLVPVDKAQEFESNLKNLPPEKRLNWNRYSVRRGDSLIAIAKKFNTTPKLIKQVNHLRSNMIREKQKLLIPLASKGKSYYDLSQQNRLENKQKNLKGSKGSSKVYHTVKAGDTMWDLSLAHKVGVRALAKWNGMAPTDVLKPGKKLLIWSNTSKKTMLTTATEVSPPFTQKREMIKRIGYRVRKGDSLAKIANKFSVSINNLVVWNKLNKNKYLQPGQKLTIFVDLSNS